ncbi:rhomboid-like protein [Streptomyces sp. NPDC046465]|uniref:rhomboid-like protein n=1 Tax=Streptomyces sp. NPDC046465 TaxID=3155810 RepID=UPI0033D497ED
MNQSVRPAAAASDAATPGTLNGIPRQPAHLPPPGRARAPHPGDGAPDVRTGAPDTGGGVAHAGSAALASGAAAIGSRAAAAVVNAAVPGSGAAAAVVDAAVTGSGAAVVDAAVTGSGAAVVGPCTGAVQSVRSQRLRALSRLGRLLPTPTGTPFTFGYALVLAATSMVARYADPDFVDSLLRGSSTDVAHLAHNPALVLVASALWIAGGITSPYAVGFLLVLTALERRIGGIRTAAVFLLGHVVATLVTEVPVAVSVLAGHLPGSSLHRLDYGISFGVAASVGALAGLLTPWLRWTVLAGFGCVLVEDLIAFTDPMTSWGHLLALLIGVATWPLLRLRRRPARPVRGASPTGAGRRPGAGPHRAP